MGVFAVHLLQIRYFAHLIGLRFAIPALDLPDLLRRLAQPYA